MLADIIDSLYSDLPEHHATHEVAEFLRESLPAEIVDDLLKKTSAEFIIIGPIDLFPINELKSLNLDDNYSPWYRNDYVTIAQGPNQGNRTSN